MDDRRVPSDLAALPKAEVHIHLEGTIRPATLDEFCQRSGLRVPRTFNDLNGFIQSISGAWATMTDPGDYARLVREYCEDAVRSGIRYAELELVPAGRPYDCLGEAVEAASRQRDVVVRFVAGLNRDLPLELAWMMLDAAKDVPEVVAVGLGGAESGFPPEPFSPLFAEARRRGLRSAPHAGEDAGPASVRGALDALGAELVRSRGGEGGSAGGDRGVGVDARIPSSTDHSVDPARRAGGPGVEPNGTGEGYALLIDQATLVSSFGLIETFSVFLPSFSCQSSTS